LDAEFKLNPRCISSSSWRKVLEFRNKGLGEEREDTRVIDPKGGTMISSTVVTVPTRGGGTHYTQYRQTESSYWITSQEMLNMRWVFYNFSPLLKYQNIFAIFVTALFFLARRYRDSEITDKIIKCMDKAEDFEGDRISEHVEAKILYDRRMN